MPILSFDADNRHNSPDYFTHCTHVERDDNELHKQYYTPYKPIGGLGGFPRFLEIPYHSI